MLSAQIRVCVWKFMSTLSVHLERFCAVQYFFNQLKKKLKVTILKIVSGYCTNKFNSNKSQLKCLYNLTKKFPNTQHSQKQNFRQKTLKYIMPQNEILLIFWCTKVAYQWSLYYKKKFWHRRDKNLTLGHLYRVIVRFFMNHFFLQTVIGKITFNFFILFACCLMFPLTPAPNFIVSVVHQRHQRSFGIPLAIPLAIMSSGSTTPETNLLPEPVFSNV